VHAEEQPDLDEAMMEIIETAVELSLSVYDTEPDTEGYTSLTIFDDNKRDRVVVAKKGDLCYVSFRGTDRGIGGDWRQNNPYPQEQVCMNTGNNKEECCRVTSGFNQAYNADFREVMEDLARSCVEETCNDTRDCLVLTGHSQGAAIANVAALYLRDLNPYVIQFASPPAIQNDCSLVVDSTRWYRFINTRVIPNPSRFTIQTIRYDPVPSLYYTGMGSYGYMIVLSDDASGVANFGLDHFEIMMPFDTTVRAHGIQGYLNRIRNLLAAGNSFPIRTTGYSKALACTENQECESGRCEVRREYFPFNFKQVCR
jgi:hypothetical protein